MLLQVVHLQCNVCHVILLWIILSMSLGWSRRMLLVPHNMTYVPVSCHAMSCHVMSCTLHVTDMHAEPQPSPVRPDASARLYMDVTMPTAARSLSTKSLMAW